MIWDAAAIAELTLLWDSPEAPSAAIIAACMGTPSDRPSRSAIIGKVHRLGLSKRKSATGVQRPKPRHRPVRHDRPVKSAAPPTVPAPVEPMPDMPDDLIPIEQRRQLQELTNSTCRWPCGDPATPEFFFCGHESADVIAGRPYCAAHTARGSGGPGRAPNWPSWEGGGLGRKAGRARS